MNRRTFLVAGTGGGFLIDTRHHCPKGCCPMPTRFVYSDSRQAVADAAGIATVLFVGPTTLTERRIDSVVVSCSSSTPRPVCTVYRGGVSAGNVMASSPVGDRDTFAGDNDSLHDGEQLVVQWTGAAVGAVCTAIVRGEDSRA